MEVSPYVLGIALPTDSEQLVCYVLVLLIIYMGLLILEKAREILPTLCQVVTAFLLTAVIVATVVAYLATSRVSSLFTDVSQFIVPPTHSASSSWNPFSRNEL
jgi:hypothetical protein